MDLRTKPSKSEIGVLGQSFKSLCRLQLQGSPMNNHSFTMWMNSTHNHVAKDYLYFPFLSGKALALKLPYIPLKVQWSWCLLSLNLCSAHLNYARWTTFSFQQCRTLKTTLSTERDGEVVKGARAQHLHLMCLWHKFTQYFQLNKLSSIQTQSSITHCSILNSDG